MSHIRGWRKYQCEPAAQHRTGPLSRIHLSLFFYLSFLSILSVFSQLWLSRVLYILSFHDFSASAASVALFFLARLLEKESDSPAHIFISHHIKVVAAQPMHWLLMDWGPIPYFLHTKSSVALILNIEMVSRVLSAGGKGGYVVTRTYPVNSYKENL